MRESASELIEFETPENVVVRYRVAGLGSRFVAWFIDFILLCGLVVVIAILLLIFWAGGERLLREAASPFEDIKPGEVPQLEPYAAGLLMLVLGLSSFLYFGLSEYLLHGQTAGKRQLSIRVVKANGFSLDAGSIFIRNIFRVIDHVPALWVVPFVARSSQRLGDMVAGTVVVSDEQEQVSGLRERLLRQPASARLYQFDSASLRQARPGDVEAAERFLNRWAELKSPERESLLASICEPLARRLRAESPGPESQLRFLEDFLAAEYRRQYRQLG